MNKTNVTLYGIKNCDTVKKARHWLTEQHIAYTFHDFKKEGVNEAQLARWSSQLGWESLVNKRGLTWRRLPQADKDNINQPNALLLMQTNTSLIKRPVLEVGDHVLVGFDLLLWQKLLV